ncbi:hypothetical protein [Rhabdochromatium marinum]|uniref:hypothetical protein n=1 Tax=Rhabdochromatium marinum TaxID=48729 RepID=UPI0019060956|nr:hypothetical protein [Rhabdochromatium marinum]MBK1649899.1 hypothetical protein [Rhabdochromatium marinum]
MYKWLIKQDRPNGGILSFAGTHAFETQWILSADPPITDSPQATSAPQEDDHYWFRTGDDDDDIVVEFYNLHWHKAPPDPKRAARLLAHAVNAINAQTGERF